MNIQTVSALAAAGKTYSAIDYTTRQVRAGERFIFVVPSTLLVEQIADDCRKTGCASVVAYHSADGVNESVTARLTKHFQRTDYERGEIVVMTWAALERLPYIERRASWHLIIDEAPSPVYHERFSLHENRNHLLRLIDSQPWNAGYSLISASERDTSQVHAAAHNRLEDQITGQMSAFANHLTAHHWHCFASNDQLAVFRDPPDAPSAIDVFALLQPTLVAGFKSVTLMAACLHDTMIYRYWLSLGLTFKPHPHIKPRFTKYPNADRVTIQYAIDRAWSAKLRDTVIDGKRVIDTIAERCMKSLGGDAYVYLVNKSETEMSFPKGTALPHVAHGLNCYAHLHNAMILSSLNPPPAYFGFCQDMAGLNSEEIRTAIYRTTCYQSALRISIRDLDDTHPKRIQVADKATAMWLADLIGATKIERLAGNDIVAADGRRVGVRKSNPHKCADYRAKKKTELLAGLDEVNAEVRDTISFIDKDAVSRDFHVGDVFRDKFSAVAATDTSGMSVAAFCDFLRESHGESVATKENRPLISPSHFDPSKAETSRGNENIVSISGVWLDNDGGDLTPAQFAKMMNTPMCIFNSFSSTVEAPRWRVWIPTSHLLTAEVHKEILAQIRKMLVDRKFYGASYIKKHPAQYVKHHGFDEGKMAQAVLFYLPSQALAGSEASFFSEHNWDQPVLNPYEWVDRSIIDHRPPTIPFAVQPPLEAAQTPCADKTDEAEAEAAWRSHGKGEGNAAFFKLAVAYRRAGLPWSEAEERLGSEAHWSHGSKSTRERLSDMKNIRRKIWGS